MRVFPLLPMYAGFHPYFKTIQKQFSLQAAASRIYDYNTGQTSAFNGEINLNGKKEAVLLVDQKTPDSTFQISDQVVELSGSAAFKYTLLWTEKGEDFVCVDPWMAKTDELNRKEELVWIEPGKTFKTLLSIKVKPEE